MASTMVAGSDVFRFLGLHMLSKQSDYKARVRNAIRAGVPVSTALRLQTKRSAVFRGDEAFVAHWTPLKDEKATYVPLHLGKGGVSPKLTILEQSPLDCHHLGPHDVLIDTRQVMNNTMIESRVRNHNQTIIVYTRVPLRSPTPNADWCEYS